MKLDGYTLNNKLRIARRKHPLTATEQALYHELVAMCNDVEWDDVFSASNFELCSVLCIDEKTLIKSRNTLIQANLIFYKTGKSKRTHSLYSFTKAFKVEKSTGIIPVDKPVVEPVVTPVVEPVDNGLLAGIIPDINTETNETKQNKEEAAETFEEAWEIWKLYKLEEFKFRYKSQASEKIALDDLINLSGNNPAKAKELVKNAIAKGWKGIFPIKEEQQRQRGGNVVQLSDYQQRLQAELEKARNWKPTAEGNV